MRSNPLLKIILASASPRRVHILQEHGLHPIVRPAHIDELVQPGEDAKTYVTRLAKEKAEAVLPQVAKDDIDLIIAADTTVSYEQHILEKPKDREDAFRMLRMLSGATHHVYTGYALVFLPEQRWWVDYVTTEITFHALSEEQMQQYIDSGEPFDKAGGYGIQQVRESFVKEIKGSYYNVMGLPIEDILKNITLGGAP